MNNSEQLNVNYEESLKSIRFNFVEDKPLDYQILLSLIMSIIDENKFDEFKDAIFQTVQVLVLVYGLEDTLNQENFNDSELADINDLSLWNYLLVSVFKDMESNSNFEISEKTIDKVKKYLLLLNNSLNCIETKSEECEPLEKACNNKPEEEFCKKINNDCLDDFNLDFLNHYIITNNLIKYECARCGMNEWQGKSIPLKLSHKKAFTNNNIDNLEFLCPNCYSQIGK